MNPLEKFARQERRANTAAKLRQAESYAIARSPIQYAPQARTVTELERALDISTANAKVGVPIFCVHGRLARIQCHKCG